jgi:chitinase
MPCQVGFGSCEIKKGRTCGTGSGTTNGRTIGYYQGSNTRERLCNLISPSDIASGPSAMFPKGYTHLYYAFASIDPGTFAIVPADQKDIDLYTQFTKLQSRGLQTLVLFNHLFHLN